jgi:hypothetical protein
MVARVGGVVTAVPVVVQAAVSAGVERAEASASEEARAPAGEGAAEQAAAPVVSEAPVVSAGEAAWAAPAALRFLAATGSASRARRPSIALSTAVGAVMECAHLERTARLAQPIV